MSNSENPCTGLAVQGLGDEGNANSFASTTNVSEQESFPPGLLGETAHWVLQVSPRPVPTIALATAISLISAIAGRSFNIKGQGLNQYIIVIGHTGSGKDITQAFPEVFYNTLRRSVPAVDDFRGAAELGSAQGFTRHLEKKPFGLFAFGEIGILLVAMTRRNASPHLVGILRLWLQVYSKSGRGNALGSTVYSDAQKNTAIIDRPSPTIIGDTTPDTFYGALDDGLISSGLIPRFLLFEYLGGQVPLATGFDTYQPDPSLIQSLANLVADSLSLNASNQIRDVVLDPKAEALFAEFEEYSRNQLNAAASDVFRHLWNRSHLKALKLAAVCAVGINHYAPIIGPLCAQWAIDIVAAQTRDLISKFDAGEVGEVAGDEVKQLNELIKVIAAYICGPFDKVEGYGGFTNDMHRDHVFTGTYLSRRLIKLATFKHDKSNATNALNRALKSLLDSDEIREIAKSQMQIKYGSGAKAYIVSSPPRFIQAWKAHK